MVPAVPASTVGAWLSLTCVSADSGRRWRTSSTTARGQSSLAGWRLFTKRTTMPSIGFRLRQQNDEMKWRRGTVLIEANTPLLSWVLVLCLFCWHNQSINQSIDCCVGETDYISAEGKTKVGMMFASGDDERPYMEITKALIKVCDVMLACLCWLMGFCLLLHYFVFCLLSKYRWHFSIIWM